ncbi:MAG: HAD-IIB family hydrolase [Pseudomonadota bacterium]
MDRSTPPVLVVFSDLDGTLLDHKTYAFEAARPALAALQEIGSALILASSKTAREIAPIRDALGFSHCPAIAENGAGVMPPGKEAQGTDDAPYRDLRQRLDRLPSRFRDHFAGFGDWSTEEVARQTGLSREAASAARARQFSEPGLWSGTEAHLPEFLRAISDVGLSARRGGRFLTLSFGGSKADRMEDILASYTPPGAPPPRSLALGDAPNDVEMLERADRGIIIFNPGGTPIQALQGERDGTIIRSTLPGPEGWNVGVRQAVAEVQKPSARV